MLVMYIHAEMYALFMYMYKCILKMSYINRKILHLTTSRQLVNIIYFFFLFLTPTVFSLSPPILLSFNQTLNVMLFCCLFCWFLKMVRFFFYYYLKAATFSLNLCIYLDFCSLCFFLPPLLILVFFLALFPFVPLPPSVFALSPADRHC